MPGSQSPATRRAAILRNSRTAKGAGRGSMRRVRSRRSQTPPFPPLPPGFRWVDRGKTNSLVRTPVFVKRTRFVRNRMLITNDLCSQNQLRSWASAFFTSESKRCAPGFRFPVYRSQRERQRAEAPRPAAETNQKAHCREPTHHSRRGRRRARTPSLPWHRAPGHRARCVRDHDAGFTRIARPGRPRSGPAQITPDRTGCDRARPGGGGRMRVRRRGRAPGASLRRTLRPSAPSWLPRSSPATCQRP